MQTFLPYPDFVKSARCLDYKRLGKQRVEAYQILRTLLGESEGWINHPATKMWRGHESALAGYMNAMIEEWVRRGYNNTMGYRGTAGLILPRWFGDPDFHASHQSNLLRKDPAFYGQYGWPVPSTLPYVWPKP